MDANNFLSEFNVSEKPVYAKKSAPPPPEHSTPRTPELPKYQATFPNTSACSTPSPSLLDSSNENSSLMANTTGRDESPMETDAATQQGSTKNEKKTRGRSRAKKTLAKTHNNPPDVNLLLANLENKVGEAEKGRSENGAHLPPLPLEDPPAVLPPLPPQPATSPKRTQDAEKDQSATKKVDSNTQERKSARNKENKTKKEAKNRSAISSENAATDKQNDQGHSKNKTGKNGGTSQRTTGRQPAQGSDTFPSHNRQWTKTGQQESAHHKESGPMELDGNQQQQKKTSEQQQSAYNQRPGAATSTSASAICYDVTSHRFSPEDDKRIDLLLRKMRGDVEPSGGNNSDKQIVLHNFPTIYSNEVTGTPLDQAPGASSLYDMDDGRFLSVIDFATIELPDVAVYHTIPRRDAITFLVVHRPVGTRGKIRWEFPPVTFCQDFINEVINGLYTDPNAEAIQVASAYIRSGKWGKLQTIVLSSEHPQLLQDFRRNFASREYKDNVFDTFPRDVLTVKPDVSILLRASMKTFNTELIPKVLFSRNQSLLGGALRVLSTRFFGADEKSHKGESKEYWRSVDLKGDEQFLRCLRFIPESKPFYLGYDAVQIRGGLRPNDPDQLQYNAGSKRKWVPNTTTTSPLLVDPRTDPSSSSTSETSTPVNRGHAKRGRGGRGNRRGRFQRF